jgi:hypothetical protein
LLTLATAIGESDVAGAPSIVVPDARFRTIVPSRTTVIVAARFAAANRSNARFAASIAGAGGGATVVLVVVDVVLVVVDVVPVVAVVVLVLGIVVLVPGFVVLVVVVLVDVVLIDVVLAGAGSGPTADEAAHPAATRTQPTTMMIGRTPTSSR